MAIATGSKVLELATVATQGYFAGYQEGPYGRPIFGTEASLARITGPDLRRFWQANYTGDRIRQFRPGR